MSSANPGGNSVSLPGAPFPAGRKTVGGFAVNLSVVTPVVDINAPNGRIVLMQGVRSFGEGGQGGNNADRVMFLGSFYLDYYKSNTVPFWAWPGGTAAVTIPAGVDAALVGQTLRGNFVVEAIIGPPTAGELASNPNSLSYFTLRLDGHDVVIRAPMPFLGNSSGLGRVAVTDQPFRGDFRVTSFIACTGGYGDAEVPSQITDTQIVNARVALKAEITA